MENNVQLKLKTVSEQVHNLYSLAKAKKEGLEKVLAILKAINDEDRFYTLFRFLNVLKIEDNALYDRLKNDLLLLSEILPSLDNKSLSVLLRKISPKQFYMILSTFNDEQLEKIYKNCSTRKADMLKMEVEYLKGKHNNNEIIQAKQDFIEEYIELMENNSVKWIDDMAIFKNIECKVSEPSPKPEVIFFSNKSSFTETETIKLFLYSSKYKTKLLLLQAKKNKKIIFTKRIILDEHGFYNDDIDINQKEGIYNLEVLTDKNQLVASLSVLIGVKSSLNVNLTNINNEQVNNKNIISFKVNGFKFHIDEKYKMKVICLQCQNIIDASFIDIKNGEGDAFVFVEDHDGPFIINFVSISGSISILLPSQIYPVNETKSFNLDIKSKAFYGEEINLTLNNKDYKNGFIILTEDNHNLLNIKNTLSLLPYNKISNQCDIVNKIIENKHFELNANENRGPDVRIIDSFDINKVIKIIVPFSNKKNLVLQFLLNNGDSWQYFTKKIKLFYKDNLMLDFPVHLDKEDKIEGRLIYSTTEKGELVCSNGDIKKEEVSGRGIKKILLYHTSKLSFELRTDRLNKSEDWENTERTIKKQKFKFLKKNEEYIPKDNVFLYPNANYLFSEISLNGLLNYSWGCGEQTAAKLNGLVRCYRIKNYNLFDYNEEMILKIINDGLNRMKLFEKQPGFYSIWESGEPNESDTKRIYENLFIFRLYPINEFKSRVDKMLTLIENKIDINVIKYKNNYKLTDRYENNDNQRLISSQQPENQNEKPIENINNHILRIKNRGYIKNIDEVILVMENDVVELKKAALSYIFNTGKVYKNNSVIWENNNLTYDSWITNTSRCLKILFQNKVKQMRRKKLVKSTKIKQERNLFYKILETINLVSPQYDVKNEYIKENISNYFLPTINEIAKSFKNFMVGSTADTVEFMDLIDTILDGSDMTYEVNNQVLNLENNILETKNPVKIVSNIGLVREDYSINLNTNVKSDFKFKIHLLTKKTISKGENFILLFDPKDYPLNVPLLDLYLPGNLTIENMFQNNISEQRFQFPLKPNEPLKLLLKAIRRGTGRIFMHLHDMYNTKINSYRNDIVVKVY